MTTETTQSVASDASAQASVPAASAENAGGTKIETLDDILKEFGGNDAGDAAEGKSTPETKPTETIASKPAASTADPELKAIKDKLEALEREESRKQLETVIGRIKGDSQVDPDLVETYLNLQARKNPALQKAYVNRFSNPAAWSKVESQLAKDIRAKFGGGGQTIDPAVTETRESIAAAVRGSSTAAKPGELSDKDVFSMSKSEFDALQRKMGVRP